MHSNFPSAGDTVTFSGVPKYYYPMFTCMKKYADEHLVVGNTYTLARVDVMSSWCSVTLVGHESQTLNWRFFHK